MDIAAIGGLALAAAALCALLRRYHGEYALLISVGAGILIVIQMFSSLIPIVHEIETLSQQAGIASEYGEVLFKAVGICFLAQFAGDACRDAGETALASRVETAARLAMTAAALPLFRQLAEMALALIGGGT